MEPSSPYTGEITRQRENISAKRSKKKALQQIPPQITASIVMSIPCLCSDLQPSASLRTKLVDVMEFQLSYFNSWKMMPWKCRTQYASKFGNLSRPQNWKRSVFIPVRKKGNVKECSNYHTIAVISHASKVMLKTLQPGSSNTWTENFQMFKLVLEKAEEPEIKLPTSISSSKKWQSSRKTSTSALLTTPVSSQKTMENS